MKEEEVLKKLTGTGMFIFVRKNRKTYSFAKAD
jgi:hypothetical protein